MLPVKNNKEAIPANSVKIRDLVQPEMDYYKEKCNFTPDELRYFELKAKDYSNVQISLEMLISERTVSELSKRVNRKMDKVAFF